MSSLRPDNETGSTRRWLLPLLFAALVVALVACAAPGTPTPATTATKVPAAPAATTAAIPTSTPLPAVTPTPKPKEKVSFRLDWLISGYQMPFYLALDKGYYDDEGLSVTIQAGQGSGVAINLVGSGSDTFGFTDGPTMLTAITKGLPVKMVALISRKSPQAVVSLKETNITKPKDMEGKSIAWTPGSAGETIWPAFCAANGLDCDKAKLINTDAASKNTLMLQKKADTILAPGNVARRFDAQGSPSNAMFFADNGMTLVGYGIIASDATIKAKPDVVKHFVAASLRGWDYSRSHPDEALAATKKYVDNLPPSLVEEMKVWFGLLDSDDTKGKPLGWQSTKDWTATQDILAKYGGLEKQLPIDSYFTNDYVPAK